MVSQRRTNSFEDIFEFFTIYHWNVWIFIFSEFILFTLFGMLIRYVELKLGFRKELKFTEILWQMASNMLNKPQNIKYRLISGYFFRISIINSEILGRSSLLIFNVFQISIILGLFQSLILTSVFKVVDF